MRTTSLLLLFIVISITPATFVFFSDPYQYFHKSIFRPNFFIKRAGRMQSPGIIRNYIGTDARFDTLIMGGSLAQNFEAKRVTKIFSSDKNIAINLAFSGATAFEQAFVTKKALKTNKIKTVFWSIGPGWRMSADFTNDKRTFPYYLYNDNSFDDLNYLFSAKSFNIGLNYIFTLMFSRKNVPYFGKVGVPIVPLHRYSSWAPFNEKTMAIMNKRIFSEQSRIKIQKKLKQSAVNLVDGKIPLINYSDLPPDAYVSERILLEKLIKTNPDVQFVLLFPPVSTLYYHTVDLDNVTKTTNRPFELVKIAENYSNARVFGFSEDFIINDLRYYKDAAHYDRAISRFILLQIKRGKGELTSKNVNRFVRRLKQSINNFNRYDPIRMPEGKILISFSGRPST